MKRLNILWMLVGCMFLTTSCSDDDDSMVEASLQVIKSDVTFGAVSSTGTIEVQSSSAITATCSEDWCSLTVSGNVVTVTVPTYTGLTGRSAVVEITNASGGKARVPVSQSGGVWYVKGDKVYGLTDEESSITIPVKSDYEYTVETPAWIDGEKVQDGYQLTLAENTTGNARKGTAIFKSERGTKEITFVQFGENDIAGTYEATYYNYGESGEWVKNTAEIELVQDERDKTMFYANGLSVVQGLKLPMQFDIKNYEMDIFCAKYLGAVTISGSSAYLYTIMASEAGYVHSGLSLYYPALAELDVDEEKPMPFFPFKDEKGFSFEGETGTINTKIQAVYVYAFASKSPSFSGDNGLGYIDIFKDLSLKKISK